MKCPSCGAETTGDFCEYCNSELPKNEKWGKCPKCGNSSVKFTRERIGSNRNSRSSRGLNKYYNDRSTTSVKQEYYRTIGVCQKCGYTWQPNVEDSEKTKSHGFWWWVLVILFFPISLSIWFWKTDKIKLSPKIRAIILAAFWILTIVVANNNDNDDSASNNSSVISEETAQDEKAYYENDEVVNQFISNYNDISSSPFSDIKKGNVNEKCFANSYGYYCELLHAADTDKIVVKINETYDNYTGIAKMRDVFHDTVLSIDSNLTDDEIYAFFDELVEENAHVERTYLGKTAIEFKPEAELSDGNYSEAWIHVEEQA